MLHGPLAPEGARSKEQTIERFSSIQQQQQQQWCLSVDWVAPCRHIADITPARRQGVPLPVVLAPVRDYRVTPANTRTLVYEIVALSLFTHPGERAIGA